MALQKHLKNSMKEKKASLRWINPLSFNIWPTYVGLRKEREVKHPPS